jgi:DNA processing protein
LAIYKIFIPLRYTAAMEEFPIETINALEVFPQLAEIPQPPRTLFMRGSLERIIGTVLVTVVGSRNYSSYGKYACEKLIKGLRDYPVTIVSGLAIGIDAIAHQAALDAGLPTIVFPGSGLHWDALYPRQHKKLAEAILRAGGILLSEFDHDIIGAPWTFPQRNRLEAGIAHMTLVIEAEEQSGTLITSRLATEYNKTVGAVPGPINSPTSVGANWLLKLGAVPITDSADIIRELGFQALGGLPFPNSIILNDTETLIINALTSPHTKEGLLETLHLDPVSGGIAFSSLEIKGVIREVYGRIERIC